MMRQLNITTILTLISLLFSATPALAQEMTPLHVLLLADTPPSAEAVARASLDPICDLIALVEDEDELMLVRRRAVFVLGQLGSRDDVEPFLLGLLRNSPHGTLRRASASSLNRLLGTTATERLVEHLEPMITSSDPLDREMAVMLLGQLETPRASQRLSRLRITERHRAVVDALRRVFGAMEQPIP